MAALTLDELHESKKTALALVNLFRHAGGMVEAFDAAIALKDEHERLARAVEAAKKTLATTLKREEEAEASVLALQQQHAALASVIADETARVRQAAQAQLDAEVAAERERLTGTYAQLEADVALLDSLKAEATREIEGLDVQIAERQAVLRTVQAQLQAMLVGGGV